MRHKAAGHRVRDFDFAIKAVEQDGFFSGYGSAFGIIDSYREIVAPGAFSASLAARAAKGRKLPALWQHRAYEPIGVYDQVAEDDTGLYVEGRLLVDAVPRAKEAHALMRAGIVTGLSIGYYVEADSWNEKDRIRTLTQLDLQEVSIVTFPANDESRIDTVKARFAAGELPTLPEFERFLREAGCSKSQAAAIASRGLRHLLRSDSGEGATAGEILGALRSFQI